VSAATCCCSAATESDSVLSCERALERFVSSVACAFWIALIAVFAESIWVCSAAFAAARSEGVVTVTDIVGAPSEAVVLMLSVAARLRSPAHALAYQVTGVSQPRRRCW
jgi:hypothetical protein